MKTKKVLKTEKGGFHTYEEYASAERTFKDKKINITITRRILTEPYDVCWALLNYLTLSEHAKMEIERHNFQGIEIGAVSYLGL